ncbi:MAG: Abi family protein [Verrucomicrobia bacterium]|nr:Abi family protein [Verrucomicrobiota bacterium]
MRRVANRRQGRSVLRLPLSLHSPWESRPVPQAYEHSPVFRNPHRHAGALARLDGELQRSDEVFVSPYRNEYQMRRPPIWAVCEVMSFGLLSTPGRQVKSRQENRVIQSIR